MIKKTSAQVVPIRHTNKVEKNKRTCRTEILEKGPVRWWFFDDSFLAVQVEANLVVQCFFSHWLMILN